MENELHKRDHTGVQDFVLLEDFMNPEAFVENLRKRFNANLIYTYIGPVLVSVNPYQNFDIYNEEYVQIYRNVNFYELPPHIFAIADAAYRSMRGENRNHCVLISGESGAGKTEASKKILQYIAASSKHMRDVEQVKDRLLQSNPILEAFGNAKTNRNDNSSRFGKYMDIQFDFKGVPVGGHILNYLLEKSRVCHHSEGERNFHIFYQLIAGGTPLLLSKLRLTKDAEKYHYLTQGKSVRVDALNDHKDFNHVKHALDVCDFTAQEQEALFSIVASVLHLGNIQFDEDDDGLANITDFSPVENISQLLGCPEGVLQSALQNRTIEAKGEKMKSPLNKDQALYARDALAKGVYDRLFTWIVKKVNNSLNSRKRMRCSLMGILDIYGFEIFGVNSFEQFCINYCNEKLQQLFIELTLKSEQEEYQREGIAWEKVDYFNNKIICDLVEGKPVGIIAIMDEECLRPGEPTDGTFLEKLNLNLGQHPHFVSHSSATDVAERKSIGRDEFRLLHFAGQVTYSIQGFLDKNNDTLFRDLKEAMSQTSNKITSQCFPQAELQNKKRPNTAATQFKTSLAQLMEILMSKEPSYVRCIKPNDYKRSDQFDDQIVHHQVKYLGLMENLRVRRAGFAYRRPYEIFLNRYKSLCPDTWPHFDGTAKEGVEVLVNHLQYSNDDYRLGKTKLFIRFPRVLFATEDAFQLRKHDLATLVQARYRGFAQKKKFQTWKLSAIRLQSHWRRVAAQRLLKRRKQAAERLRGFIKGFIHRLEPECDENKHFIQYTKYNYLTKLKDQLPKNVLDKNWPPAPQLLQETSQLLRDLCMRNLTLRYVKSITPARKAQMEEKVVAESLFRGKKESYSKSVEEMFAETRLDSTQEEMLCTTFDTKIKQPDEKVQYSAPVTKFDRHGYKSRKRILVLTDKHLYLLDEKSDLLKDKLPFQQITGLLTSSLSDGLFVITINMDDNGSKGDLILHSDRVIELVTKIVIHGKKSEAFRVISETSITHGISGGKKGCIEFTRGQTSAVKKAKNGNLCVMVAQ
ncbi:unconventional myosin-Ic-like [Saccostrea echinata]|uniref:unconventional myosin-Ic-like n=1 Tax=Saccostrea echinata TaxID=191078 RepID=UPI002A7FD19A|nr:unconventional myosin-Ic-like [Saccostrea echinata]